MFNRQPMWQKLTFRLLSIYYRIFGRRNKCDDVMPPIVKYLVDEAVSLYNNAVSNQNPRAYKDITLCKSLPKDFENKGWKVEHPGADKWVAIKGDVVAKWLGRCSWSENAIKDELEIHRVLIEKGFEMYRPKLYANFDEQFLVEQRADNPGFKSEVYDIKKELYAAGIEVIDICGNVGELNGTIKIFDGKLELYE